LFGWAGRGRGCFDGDGGGWGGDNVKLRKKNSPGIKRNQKVSKGSKTRKKTKKLAGRWLPAGGDEGGKSPGGGISGIRKKPQGTSFKRDGLDFQRGRGHHGGALGGLVKISKKTPQPEGEPIRAPQWVPPLKRGGVNGHGTGGEHQAVPGPPRCQIPPGPGNHMSECVSSIFLRRGQTRCFLAKGAISGK